MQANPTAATTSMVAILEMVRRRKLYILLPALVMAAAAAVYVYRLPPLYRTQAVLVMEPPVSQDYIKWKEPETAPERLRAIREVLFSRPVLEETVRAYPAAAGGAPVSDAQQQLKSRIAVQTQEKNAFSISFEGSDNRLAADVANTLADLFVTHASNQRAQRAFLAAQMLRSEVERLGVALREQESRVDQYKANAIDELPERLPTNLRMLEATQTLIQSKATRIDEEEARRAGLQSEVKALDEQGIMSGAPPQAPSPVRARLEAAQLSLKQLRMRYTELHPEVIRSRGEVEQLERAAGNEQPPKPQEPSPVQLRYLQLKAEDRAAEQRIQAYRNEAEELAAQFAAQEARLETLPRHERSLSELNRDSLTARTQYQTLLQKQQDTEIAARMEQANAGAAVRVVEPAPVPLTPYAPKRLRIILMGLCGGLVLGCMLAFLAEQADTSFGGADDFQNFASLPVLAVVPSIAALRTVSDRIVSLDQHRLKTTRKFQADTATSQSGGGVLLTMENSPAAAEQFRILALKARLRLGAAPSSVLAVSSTAVGEGKTTCSVNLAMALAEAQEGPVILVDCDLQNPSIHRYLDLNPRKRLSELLLQPDDDLADYVQTIQGLSVIAGDTKPADTARLAPARIEAVISRLRRDYRYVILDAPPILPTADTHLLAGVIEGLILVVRSRHTRREVFRRAVESLDSANILGVVLNDVEIKYPRPSSRAYPQTRVAARVEARSRI